MVGTSKVIHGATKPQLRRAFKGECVQGEIQGSSHSLAVPFYSTHSTAPCAKWPPQAASAGVIKAFTLRGVQHSSEQILGCV